MRKLLVTGLLLAGLGVGAQELDRLPSQARAADGRFIAWREHLIDDEVTSGGIELRGSDGLVMADLNRDGFEDIVSVHESDDQYDGVPEGHIRIAYGTADPDVWKLVTLADGPEAGAAEDAAIGDINGDGYLDIVAACELAHLIYFENPGTDSKRWERLIPSVARDRGSFIRVFLADLDGDGRPEVVTANKGAQDPRRARQEPKAISFFEISGGKGLDERSWREHVLTELPWPINAQPVDLDGDGDLDVVGGSVAEERILWFENLGGFEFREHRVTITKPGAEEPPLVNGFNMDFADLDADGRLDIVGMQTTGLLGVGPVWLEQPASSELAWQLHEIGDYAPDQLVGLALADINGDGRLDLMTGGYSGGSRIADGGADVNDALGRLAWFEQPRDVTQAWPRHDFSRRQRGMFDKFEVRDMDDDGDLDFVGTRGNSGPYDGVFWLQQVRSDTPQRAFVRARRDESPELPLP